MNEKDILDRALEILQRTLGDQEALAFEIKPSPDLFGQKVPVAIFLVEVGKDLQKKWNLVKEMGEESIIGLKLTGKVFIVEVRRNTQPRYLRSSLSFFKQLKEKPPDWNPVIVTPYIGHYEKNIAYSKSILVDWNPLIVAPYIGPRGRELCRQEGVSYIDTLGNIGIFLKDSFILKESKESIKTEARTLKSLFSTKSTRIIRVILEDSTRLWKFQDLVDSSKVSLGQVYNVIKKLADEEYVEKTKQGIKVIQPAKLLDNWAKYYRFTEFNTISMFYSAERDYNELIKNLALTAKMLNYNYAFTLFASALLVAPYVRTPFIHLYMLGDMEKFAQKANLRPVTSGGNVSLIKPYDEGVLNIVNEINGIRIVGNIQLYLDLINYPARGKEQAEFLREKKIRF
jgi:hypothetical protein